MTKPQASPPMQENPPNTVSELRALMLAIARGTSTIRLGSKARAALGQILDLTGNSALLSITALAENLDVNPSTLTRLAHSLGYSGFPAFQKVLLSASMAAPGDFYTRQARSALASGSNTQSRAAQLCRENQANIDRFIEQFDAAAFDASVDMIMSAPRVAVYGIRQFHALAAFLVYGLRMIRTDVVLLDATGLGHAEGLAMLSKGDVLVSASCAPYSKLVVDMAQAAHDIGLLTVAITDRTSSPLVDSSRAALLVNHESSFISNSIGAFMVAAECLINACATSQPTETRKALMEHDHMIKLLKIEI